MTEIWATSGVDLHLDLLIDRTGHRVRASLENALRDAVRAGRLGPGTRLPSSRSLAVDLGIARNTVADAYGQLVAEGWLDARRGSATRVADRPASLDEAPATDPAPPATAGRPGHPRHDLRPGFPDLSAFPRAGWLAAARRALAVAPYQALGYPDPRGCPEIRVALAGYLARARGVRVPAGRIVVCSGFTHGLGLLSQVLRARGGRTLAVEEYGHPAHRSVVAAAGLGLAPFPVDSRGAAVSDPGPACGMLLTPAHQFPLGAALAPQRRTQAVEWARSAGGVVIEDDYDGEFRYDRQPVGAMQALAPDHVVYAGSASKSLAPGLRLGWLAVPSGLLDDVVAASRLVGPAPSSLDQLTLAEFIVAGGYDRQIRRARLAYRRRRDRLVTALRRSAPQVRITGIAAGLHALLELPAAQPEDEVVARAAAHGLAMEGLTEFHATGRASHPALVVGYGTPPDHAFTGALARLCAVLPNTGHAVLDRGQRNRIAGHQT